MKDKEFNYIKKSTDKYVNFACNSFASTLRCYTIDDLKQECYVKLLDMIKSNNSGSRPKIPMEQFIQVYKSSVFNLLRDIYRKEHRLVFSDLQTQDEEGETLVINIPDLTYNSFYDLLLKQYTELIMKKLPNDVKRTFQQMLEPDNELIIIASRAFNEGLERKAKGKLVMNTQTIKIMSVHMSERLQLSAATISRHLKLIKKVTLDVLSQEGFFVSI